MFVKAIRASTATFKVVVNETPIQHSTNCLRRWEGYAAERTKLLNDLAGVKNVVFLTTDTHANLIASAQADARGGGRSAPVCGKSSPGCCDEHLRERDRLGSRGKPASAISSRHCS